jgi:hypothetical protein
LYPVIVDPPLLAGATQVIVAVAMTPGVATRVAASPVGAPGTVLATPTVADMAELGPLVPSEFVAVTAKEYRVPLVSPVIVHARAPVVLQVSPPGVEVTV